MRGIWVWFVCLGLGMASTYSTASAQDAPKAIAIQVIVGDDGSVKILDAKTGKEIGGAGVIKVQVRKEQVQERDLDKKRLEELHRELMKLLHDKKPDDKVKVIKIEKVQRVGEAPGGVEKKLDLILKQLGELRNDVDGIKKQLGGKKPEVQLWYGNPLQATPDAPKVKIKLPQAKEPEKDKATFRFQLVLPDGKELPKELRDETHKRLEDALRQKLDGKKKDASRPDAPRIGTTASSPKAPGVEARPRFADPTAERIYDLQRTIDELRREIEELRARSK